MAIQRSVKEGKKYAHLEKVYDDVKEVKIESEEADTEAVVLKGDVVSIDKEEIKKFIFIFSILCFVGISGYVIAKFL